MKGPRNTLGDLNNHLFAQLEKMDDDELTGEQLDNEIRRTEAMAKISEQIIKNGELQFRAMSTWMNTAMRGRKPSLICWKCGEVPEI